MNNLQMTTNKRMDNFVFDAEIAPKELQVRRTKNYDQFLSIKGNRKISMGHVNNLIKMISKYNLLSQFVGVVTKDGYIIDGQHRLEAAKTNKLWFYFTVIPDQVDDIIVSLVNAVQLKWSIDDYVNFFADRNYEQYIWLRDLHRQYKISNSSLIQFLAGGGGANISKMRRGELKLYNNSDDQQNLLALIEGYMDLRSSIDTRIWVDQDFIRALRVIFQQFNSTEIKTAIEKYGKIITVQDHDKDYLRLFEDVMNKKKYEKNHIRFF